MPDTGLTGSLEDYLEAIYQLIQKSGAARVKELADFLDVRKSSVTVALRALAAKQLIHYMPYSNITLTSKGGQLAQDIIRRHETLKDFFTQVLGVPEADADTTACKMEHVLLPEVTERLLRFMEFIALNPGQGEKWLKQFHQFYQQPSLAQAPMKSASQALPSLDLSHLKTGIKAEIIAINHTGVFRKRILEMGVTVGAVLSIERVAPMGDPIDIKIRGYHLSLRKEEAQHIQVKILG